MNILHYLNLKPVQRKSIHLSMSLIKYGLCPEDWTLIPKNEKEYKIIHNNEPDFIFEGETKIINGKVSWKKIILKSI